MPSPLSSKKRTAKNASGRTSVSSSSSTSSSRVIRRTSEQVSTHRTSRSSVTSGKQEKQQLLNSGSPLASKAIGAGSQQTDKTSSIAVADRNGNWIEGGVQERFGALSADGQQRDSDSNKTQDSTTSNSSIKTRGSSFSSRTTRNSSSSSTLARLEEHRKSLTRVTQARLEGSNSRAAAIKERSQSSAASSSEDLSESSRKSVNGIKKTSIKGVSNRNISSKTASSEKSRKKVVYKAQAVQKSAGSSPARVKILPSSRPSSVDSLVVTERDHQAKDNTIAADQLTSALERSSSYRKESYSHHSATERTVNGVAEQRTHVGGEHSLERSNFDKEASRNRGESIYSQGKTDSEYQQSTRKEADNHPRVGDHVTLSLEQDRFEKEASRNRRESIYSQGKTDSEYQQSTRNEADNHPHVRDHVTLSLEQDHFDKEASRKRGESIYSQSKTDFEHQQSTRNEVDNHPHVGDHVTLSLEQTATKHVPIDRSYNRENKSESHSESISRQSIQETAYSSTHNESRSRIDSDTRASLEQHSPSRRSIHEGSTKDTRTRYQAYDSVSEAESEAGYSSELERLKRRHEEILGRKRSLPPQEDIKLIKRPLTPVEAHTNRVSQQHETVFTEKDTTTEEATQVTQETHRVVKKEIALTTAPPREPSPEPVRKTVQRVSITRTVQEPIVIRRDLTEIIKPRPEVAADKKFEKRVDIQLRTHIEKEEEDTAKKTYVRQVEEEEDTAKKTYVRQVDLTLKAQAAPKQPAHVQQKTTRQKVEHEKVEHRTNKETVGYTEKKTELVEKKFVKQLDLKIHSPHHVVKTYRSEKINERRTEDVQKTTQDVQKTISIHVSPYLKRKQTKPVQQQQQKVPVSPVHDPVKSYSKSIYVKPQVPKSNGSSIVKHRQTERISVDNSNNNNNNQDLTDDVFEEERVFQTVEQQQQQQQQHQQIDSKEIVHRNEQNSSKQNGYVIERVETQKISGNYLTARQEQEELKHFGEKRRSHQQQQEQQHQQEQYRLPKGSLDDTALNRIEKRQRSRHQTETDYDEQVTNSKSTTTTTTNSRNVSFLQATNSDQQLSSTKSTPTAGRKSRDLQHDSLRRTSPRRTSPRRNSPERKHSDKGSSSSKHTCRLDGVGFDSDSSVIGVESAKSKSRRTSDPNLILARTEVRTDSDDSKTLHFNLHRSKTLPRSFGRKKLPKFTEEERTIEEYPTIKRKKQRKLQTITTEEETFIELTDEQQERNTRRRPHPEPAADTDRLTVPTKGWSTEPRRSHSLRGIDNNSKRLTKEELVNNTTETTTVVSERSRRRHSSEKERFYQGVYEQTLSAKRQALSNKNGNNNSADNDVAIRVSMKGGVIQLSMEEDYDFSRRSAHNTPGVTPKMRHHSEGQTRYTDQQQTTTTTSSRRETNNDTRYKHNVQYIESEDLVPMRSTLVQEQTIKRPQQLVYYTIVTHHFNPLKNGGVVNEHRQGVVKVPGGLRHEATCIFRNHLYVLENERVTIDKLVQPRPSAVVNETQIKADDYPPVFAEGPLSGYSGRDQQVQQRQQAMLLQRQQQQQREREAQQQRERQLIQKQQQQQQKREREIQQQSERELQLQQQQQREKEMQQQRERETQQQRERQLVQKQQQQQQQQQRERELQLQQQREKEMQQQREREQLKKHQEQQQHHQETLRLQQEKLQQEQQQQQREQYLKQQQQQQRQQELYQQQQQQQQLLQQKQQQPPYGTHNGQRSPGNSHAYTSFKGEKHYQQQLDVNHNASVFDAAFDSTYETLRTKRRSANGSMSSLDNCDYSPRSSSPSGGSRNESFSYSKPKLLRRSDDHPGVPREVEDDYPRWRSKSPNQPDRRYGLAVALENKHV